MIEQNLKALLVRMAALAGDTCGESGKSWQDIARDAAQDALDLASNLQHASWGDHEPFMIFPSPAEVLDVVGNEA